MPPISAVDAIGPAIQRTRKFLFQPFRFSTYLKLCLVAVFTEGFGANFSFNVPYSGSHHSSHTHGLNSSHLNSSFLNSSFLNSSFLAPPSRLTPGLIAAIAAGALAVFVIGILFFYLITRLRFAYFHCLVHNNRQIRPGWTLYRSQAHRFFWLNILVGIGFLLLSAIIAMPFIAGFWRIAKLTPPGSQPPVGMIVSLFLILLPIVFLLALAAITADLVLRDFILPHFALENATAGQAWAETWARVKTEKLTFFVYWVLRLILPVAVMMGIFLVLIVPGLIFLAVFGLLGVGIHMALATATGATVVVRIALEVLLALIAFAIALLVGICVGGPVSTAIRQYALLFYGARYPQLGALLFPPSGTPLPTPETP